MAETNSYIFQVVDKMSNEIKRMSEKVEELEKKMKNTGKNGSKSMLTLQNVMAAGVTVAAFKMGKAFYSAGAEMERLTTEFSTILGSTTAAKQRMEELAKFAQTTPFQLPGIAKASKVLETLTQGSLSSGKGLRMVGDAAAIAGVPMEELAIHVGRAYSGLQANRPIGEASMRLQELGLLTGQTRNEMEKLQKAGKGKEAWVLLQTELGKTSGGMEKLSKTVPGLVSTFKDQLDTVMRKMMESGVWDALNKAMTGLVERMNKLIDSGALEIMGKLFLNVARVIKDIVVVSFDGLVTVVSATISKISTGISWLMSGLDKAFGLLPKKIRPGWADSFGGMAEAVKGFAAKTNGISEMFASKTVESAIRTAEAFKVTSQSFKTSTDESTKKVVESIQKVRQAKVTDDQIEAARRAAELEKIQTFLDAKMNMEAINLAQVKTAEQETIDQIAQWKDERFVKDNEQLAAKLDILSDHYKTQLDMLTKKQEEELKRIQLATDETTRIQTELAEFTMSSREKEFVDLQRWYEQKLALVKGNAIGEASLMELHEAKLEAMRERYREQDIKSFFQNIDQKRQLTQSFIDAGIGLFSGFYNLRKQQDIQAIKDSAMSEEEKTKQIEAINRKYFKKEQALKIATAIMDTAASVTKTLASMPWPISAALAGMAAAQGAIQIATIKAQKFAQGGIVKKEPGVPATGDQHLIRANPGEMVLNEKQQKAFGGNISVTQNITINGDGDKKTITESMAKANKMLLRQLRTLSDQRKLTGVGF